MSARQLLEKARALSVKERIELAADIWDSVGESGVPPISEAQRTELRARIRYYEDHPNESGIPLSDIKAKLGLRT